MQKIVDSCCFGKLCPKCSERVATLLLAELLKAKRVLYVCLLNMGNEYLLSNDDAQSLMEALSKDKQIQEHLEKANKQI